MSKKSIGNKLFFATRAVLFLLALTPLLFCYKFTHPFSSTQSYFIFAVSEITLLCFTWLVCVCAEARPRFTLLDKVFLIFIAILFFTLAIGEDPFFSFWSSMVRTTGGLMWLHLTAVFIVARSVMRTLGDWVKFFVVSTIVALVSATIHLLSLVGIELVPFALGGSTFGNSTYFATYLLLSFFFALFVAAYAQKKLNRLLCLVSAIVLGATLLTVSANAARLSFFGGLVLMAALLAISFGKKTWIRLSGWFVVCALVIGFIVITTLAFQPSGLIKDAFVNYSSGARFALWNMASRGIGDKPLLGWGLENFQLVSYAHFDPCFGSRLCGAEIWFDRAHNKLLDVWVECGVFGLVSYLLIFVLAVVSLWRAALVSSRARLAFPILTAALAAYFVQNLVALETSTILLFWVFLLAIVNAASNAEVFFDGHQSYESRRPVKKVLPVVISLLFPILFYFFVVQPVRANLAVHQTFQAQEPDERRRAYDVATLVSPVGIDLRRVWLANDTVKIIWQGIPEGVELPLGLIQELNDAAALLENTLGRSPKDLRARIALGFVYHTKARFLGELEYFGKAVAVLEEGLRQSRFHPVVKRYLASVYFDQGETDEGLALTRSLIESSPDNMSAFGYHLVALRVAESQEEFESVASQALALFPSMVSDIQQLRSADAQTDRRALLYALH